MKKNEKEGGGSLREEREERNGCKDSGKVEGDGRKVSKHQKGWRRNDEAEETLELERGKDRRSLRAFENDWNTESLGDTEKVQLRHARKMERVPEHLQFEVGDASVHGDEEFRQLKAPVLLHQLQDLLRLRVKRQPHKLVVVVVVMVVVVVVMVVVVMVVVVMVVVVMVVVVVVTCW